MKQPLSQFLRRAASSISLSMALRIVFLGILIYLVCLCFQIYPKWNEIPNQTISANLIALGDVSDSSRCNFTIKINAGSYHNDRNNKDTTNTMTVWHRSINPVRHEPDADFLKKFKEVSIERQDILSKMKTYYVLDYNCSTSISARPLPSQSHNQYDSLAFSYTDKLQPCISSDGISYSGSGFVAFPKSAYNDLELRGKGELSYTTNLINSKPEMISLWDITQANYNISIACENISCDTISLEFYGATLFSNMYPEPDKISMSGIEFTNPDKIQDIQENGLQFHAEFLELKGMAAMRVFILTALLSLFIALIANAFTKYLFK